MDKWSEEKNPDCPLVAGCRTENSFPSRVSVILGSSCHEGCSSVRSSNCFYSNESFDGVKKIHVYLWVDPNKFSTLATSVTWQHSHQCGEVLSIFRRVNVRFIWETGLKMRWWSARDKVEALCKKNKKEWKMQTSRTLAGFSFWGGGGHKKVTTTSWR